MDDLTTIRGETHRARRDIKHEPLYSTSELARRFKVSSMTISVWAKHPEFPKPSALVRRGHFKVRSFAYELLPVIEWVKVHKPKYLSTQSTELCTDSRGPT